MGIFRGQKGIFCGTFGIFAVVLWYCRKNQRDRTELIMNNLIDLGNAYLEVKIIEEIICLVIFLVVVGVFTYIWIKDVRDKRKFKNRIIEQEREFNKARKKFDK